MDTQPDGPSPLDDARRPVYARGYFVELPALSAARVVTIAECFSAAWKRRFWIIGAMAASGALLFAMSFSFEVRYRASVLMLPAESPDQASTTNALLGRVAGLASLAGVSMGSPANRKDEAVALIKSRSFIEGFIQDRGLMPALAAGYRRPLGRRIETVGDAYELFVEDLIRIDEDPGSAVIRLSVTWTDRSQAAEWANGLYERANKTMRDRAVSDAQRNTEFLSRELERTSIEGVRVAIYGLLEKQISNVMLANVSEEYAFRLIDKAHTPETDEKVSPIRTLWGLVGAMLGCIAAVILAIVSEQRRAVSPSS